MPVETLEDLALALGKARKLKQAPERFSQNG